MTSGPQRRRLDPGDPGDGGWEPPIVSPEHGHQRWENEHPDDGRVQEDAQREAETELLEPDHASGDETREGDDHDRGRRRHDAAGPLEAIRDSSGVVGHLVPRLTHPGDEKHLVVHREAEERREEETGTQPSISEVSGNTEKRAAHTPLEHDHEHAVHRGDREEIQQHSLERQQERAKSTEQNEVRHGEDREDDPRESAVRALEEVDALRGRSA